MVHSRADHDLSGLFLYVYVYPRWCRSISMHDYSLVARSNVSRLTFHAELLLQLLQLLLQVLPAHGYNRTRVWAFIGGQTRIETSCHRFNHASRLGHDRPILEKRIMRLRSQVETSKRPSNKIEAGINIGLLGGRLCLSVLRIFVVASLHTILHAKANCSSQNNGKKLTI